MLAAWLQILSRRNLQRVDAAADGKRVLSNDVKLTEAMLLLSKRLETHKGERMRSYRFAARVLNGLDVRHFKRWYPPDRHLVNSSQPMAA